MVARLGSVTIPSSPDPTASSNPQSERPPSLPEEVHWVGSPQELTALGPLFAAAPWLAFDTESNSMYVYRERVCLIQVNAGGTLVIIDPFALEQGRGALGTLEQALENPEIPVYLHGGEYDCVVMNRDYGLEISAVFDSQQAASLLGWRKTGYGAVVEEVLGISLPKGHSDYDWGCRPLDAEALDYAIDDVRHLPAVVDHLRQLLQEADLEEEAAIANQAVAMVRAREPGFDPQGLWRLKGISEVPNHRLPIAMALYQWRDDLAKAHNRPPGRVLPNDLILALARSAPTNFGQLRRLKLRSAWLRDYGEDIINTVKSAQQQPPEIPEAPARRDIDPQEREREQALKAWRRNEAERRGVTTQAVLPARALDYLKRLGAADLSAVPQLGEKRIKLYGDVLRRLSGSAKAGPGPKNS
ncbi:MAG: hypothetical protein EA402_08105 [Planctomycetota bacterium]|nr:MAG: hypothetical protein EA402_08105 [Planctomycetota bacterium]